MANEPKALSVRETWIVHRVLDDTYYHERARSFHGELLRPIFGGVLGALDFGSKKSATRAAKSLSQQTRSETKAAPVTIVAYEGHGVGIEEKR